MIDFPKSKSASVWRSCRVIVMLSICAIGFAQAQTVWDSNRILDLYVGQTEILSFRGVNRVSVGDGALADVKVLEDVGQILLIAKEAGVTDLRVWQSGGRQSQYMLRVHTQSPEYVLEQVRAHLSGMEGVRARMAGDHVVIEGQSLREVDVKRVEAVAEQFPNVSNHVSAGGVTLRSMVYIDVKVLEVKKTSLEQIGVNWDDFTGGPTFGYLGDFITNDTFRSTEAPTVGDMEDLALPLAVGSGNVFLGMSTLLRSTIDLLKSRGYARILAEPKLTCRSGGEAEFLVGGELPFPVTNQLGAVNVIFKQFGIILKIAPVADADGYIAAQLEIEVSNPDFAQTVDGLPSFVNRRTATEMNVRSGETMVISGLVDSRDSKNVDKIPFLGDVPILGELFKSRGFANDQTDLVVFVTPAIVDPEHRINKEMLRKASDMQERSDENLPFSLMD